MQTGRQINERVRRYGVCCIVDLSGDKILFLPRGRLPAHMLAYLTIDDGSRARALRDYCVSLGRGVTD